MKFFLSSIGVLFAATCLTTEARCDDERGFAPIFDGETLNGWKGEEGFWHVEDGAIVGQSTDERPLDHNTFLVWEQGEVDDFELRLQFRITGSEAANSGIQFRGSQREDGHVVGYQADIDKAGTWVGALYDEARRGLLAARGQKTSVSPEGEKSTEQIADADELFQHVKQDDWNDYSITAQGSEITLKVNGHVTAQVEDGQTSQRDLIGLLALQLHAGPPMKIEFRNIRLKRFPLAEGRAKVVFVAGTPSHGYFSHEHNAGCLLLAKALNEARDEHDVPVVATVYTNGWPTDPTAFDNADTVVSYCDGGARHYLNDRLEDFQTLVDERGVGLACIHYAVETTKGECGEHFLDWIGGYFEPHWSVNPHWTAKFDDLPDHPITRGVEPFEINDEWYYHMRFQPEMEGVTPILTDMPPRETLSRADGPHSGNPYVREAVLQRKEPQHVAWAYERPGDKGRGFGFTGGHFHKNWQDDNFRKVVLNAILWTAGADVPEEGVPSKTPTQEELEANQDEPKPETADTNSSKPPAVAGTKENKPTYSSPLVTPATPGHRVDIEVDITGAKSLFLVVTDGGDGYGCDWADWAEPRLARVLEDDAGRKESETLKLTDLKWKSATANWGEVRVNKNAGGGPLSIRGKPVSHGIGTHANSVIEFELPADHEFTTFKARGGLDNGGTDQGCGSTVQFHVFTERPGPAFLARVASGSDPQPASHEIADALDQLDVHPALEASVFASEPMMYNPTDIDVDHLGRVWVCEVINYRRFRNSDQPERTEGDQILVLEDTDGDGAADKKTTFYQGRDVDSAHGICVLPTPSGKGTKAIISCGDSVFFLHDDDGDLKADRKEILFTGISGTQHDHGIHAFVFGPDGKLYFNFGNVGQQIKDKDGNPIVDKAGNEVNASRQPYQEGMVFRCNMDGSEFETLAWNFRNNWEVAVDSFGTMWQSDNDDDGNRGVRINYVMEYGNFGYKDEFTGAGWRTERTGWNDEIPLRHWHLNDPGVVPNLLQTGAGSPTGICVYEGDLLPEPFRGALIHTDAGPNICRAYVTRPDGAGYTAEIVNILDGARNKWFRPSDVCVAPDGSLLIADWYDPGVGGHRMQDVEHGRLFRITPKDHDKAYEARQYDFSTPEGAAEALKSPNLATRYMAWTALHEMGSRAEPVLARMLEPGENPRFRARALWLLGKLGLPHGRTLQYVRQGLLDSDSNIRVTAIRLARQFLSEGNFSEVEDAVNVADPSAAVRREMLIGLREVQIPEFAEAWVILAGQYDGKDRWYLEALGIAAEGRWDECLSAWRSVVGRRWNTPVGRDLVWRSRSTETPALLAELISDPETPDSELPRLFRAFDFQQPAQAQPALVGLAFTMAETSEERRSFIQTEALKRLDGFDIAEHPEHAEALQTVLESAAGTPQFVMLVEKFNVADRFGDVLKLAQENAAGQLAIVAVNALLNREQAAQFHAALRSEDRAIAEQTVLALATAADARTVPLLLELAADDGQEIALRRAAVSAAARAKPGAEALQKWAQDGDYDPALKEAIAAALHTAQWPEVKAEAAKLFPLPPGKDSEPLPSIEELAGRTGDVARGKILFHTTGTCNKCHVVNTIGQNVGPDLSEIGKKLAKPAMYESLLFPSAAISHNYETWTVLDVEGNVYSGLLVSETPDEVQIKDEKGLVRTIKTADIEEKKQQDISLMPADIQKLLTAQELVDVVEYLTTLKQAKTVSGGE